jgi:FkbM family methyltransferase
MKKIALSTLSRTQLMRQYVIKKLLKKFPLQINYFLKPNDGISYHPLIGVKHDEEVSESIIYLSQYFPNCFLDVGANIGLISLEVATFFKKIVCVEPNPIACNILRTNTLLNEGNFEIHEIGIGADNELLDLYIPKGNLGGAFVLQKNEYSQQELAYKDGYHEFNPSNYLLQTIKIQNCVDFIKNNRLDYETSLVIKIDIEGQDGKVIDTLINVLEKHVENKLVAIVFESHNLEFPKKLQSHLVKFDYDVYNPRIKTIPNMRMPIIRRLLKLLNGEARELQFWPITADLHPAYRNFICAPKDLLMLHSTNS